MINIQKQINKVFNSAKSLNNSGTTQAGDTKPSIYENNANSTGKSTIFSELSNEDTLMLNALNEAQNKAVNKEGKNINTSYKEFFEKIERTLFKNKDEELKKLSNNNIFDENIKGYESKIVEYNGMQYVVQIPIGLKDGEKCALHLELHGHLDNTTSTRWLQGAQFSNAINNMGNSSELENVRTIFIQPYSGSRTFKNDQRVEQLDSFMGYILNNNSIETKNGEKINLNINQDQITISGHSMGTGGVVNYLEKSKYSSKFNKVVLFSISDQNDVERLKKINKPILICTGTSDGKNCIASAQLAESMIKNGQLTNVSVKWFNGGHGQICTEAISGKDSDQDGNKKSDLIEFLYG